MAEAQLPEDIATHLAGLAPGKQAAAQTLLDLMARGTGETPHLWRGGIVSLGTYHYRYATGRERDAPAAGFAMRKAATTVYLLDGWPPIRPGSPPSDRTPPVSAASTSRISTR